MRKTPYTEIGIKRLKCFRNDCNNKAMYQLQIRADNNVYRPICLDCYIEINKIVLDFMGFDNQVEMMNKYKGLICEIES